MLQPFMNIINNLFSKKTFFQRKSIKILIYQINESVIIYVDNDFIMLFEMAVEWFNHNVLNGIIMLSGRVKPSISNVCRLRVGVKCAKLLKILWKSRLKGWKNLCDVNRIVNSFFIRLKHPLVHFPLSAFFTKKSVSLMDFDVQI